MMGDSSVLLDKQPGDSQDGQSNWDKDAES